MSVNSFWIGDTHFSDLGIYLGSDKSGLPSEIFMPNKELYTSNVANQTGDYYWSQRLTSGKFPLQCYADNITELQKNQIQQLLDFDKPKPLITDMRNYKYINVILDNNQIDWNYIWTRDRYGRDVYNGLFEIQFYASDPIWQSLFDSTNILGYLEDIDNFPSLFYDLGMLYSEDIPSATQEITQSPSDFQLYNGGNRFSPCIITLTGSATNLQITNFSTSQNCVISSMDNETIVIDGIRGQVHNNISLKTSKFSGDYIKINAGYNNIRITGSNLNLNTEFKYKYCYL